jgi:hypothetical protein
MNQYVKAILKSLKEQWMHNLQVHCLLFLRLSTRETRAAAQSSFFLVTFSSMAKYFRISPFFIGLTLNNY